MNNTIKKPEAKRGVAILNRSVGTSPRILDLYPAPDTDMNQVEAAAAEFGTVRNEGHYLRLTVNPVFNVEEVISYLASLWPERKGEAGVVTPATRQEWDRLAIYNGDGVFGTTINVETDELDALVEALEEDGDAR